MFDEFARLPEKYRKMYRDKTREDLKRIFAQRGRVYPDEAIEEMLDITMGIPLSPEREALLDCIMANTMARRR